MDINLTLQQQQILSQSQIQSLNILTLDNIELNQFLRDEYLENPLLDYTDTFPDMVKSEAIKSYSNILKATDYNVGDNADLLGNENPSIKEHLMSQLSIKNYTSHDWKIMEYLIDCLDDNGFFTFSPKDIAKQTGATIHVIENYLAELRRLEPAGIFTAGLAECLITQLEKNSPDFLPLKDMLSRHLDNIAAGKISVISRDLGLPTAEVRKYIDKICLLNPSPLSAFSSNHSSYIIPDIIFTKEAGDWSTKLNDDWVANYHLNDYYVEMLKTTKDPDLLAYFEGKLARVQFVFSCVEQRQKTILSITTEILNRQEAFFSSRGPLTPMTMSALSQQLGIHPSTFSRAIKGKYIQYPGGTILCKDLFTTAISCSEDKEGISSDAAKTLIKELIDLENKGKPYSDQALVQLLKEKDILLSRRVVAKYRDELGIKSSVNRKVR